MIEETKWSRRDVLRLGLAATGAVFLGASSTRIARAGFDEAGASGGRFGTYPYQLPPLPYSYDALSRSIDARTMRLHHDKHHKTYVDNLNKAIATQPGLQNRTPQELIRNLDTSDIPTAIRNNAGGHVNHSMFWQIMSPNGGGAPTGSIAYAINTQFGSFERFKTQFNDAGTKRFGSGWVWLVRDGRGLKIISTPNQDNPMMMGMFPIMGNDVWEHAYYLRYQNRRADYLQAWWNVVNWNEINRRFAASM
ncbi:MAG TPA: superoxide dismutase [Abditibacteriaceae bacterium]|jgi:Fe-Mn family superoxide dismutase|nr:superoxide dismutase [Abditibacteriaceae bacterium]